MHSSSRHPSTRRIEPSSRRPFTLILLPGEYSSVDKHEPCLWFFTPCYPCFRNSVIVFFSPISSFEPDGSEGVLSTTGPFSPPLHTFDLPADSTSLELVQRKTRLVYPGMAMQSSLRFAASTPTEGTKPIWGCQRAVGLCKLVNIPKFCWIQGSCGN
jgi:hypothetical protein